MAHLELTRELLMDVGGHVEMKKARAIHREGGVKSAEYTEGVLSGETRVSGKVKRIRMELISRTHMENHCTCLMVRRDGRVCAHIIAIGLEVIEPTQRVGHPVSESPEEDKWPLLSAEGQPLELQVMLPLKVESSWDRGQLMVGFGALLAGEEILLSALPAGAYQVDSYDEELWQTLREISPSEAPGIKNLERDEFTKLLESSVNHPRVFFGKKARARISARSQRPTLTLCAEKIVVSPGRLGAWDLKDDLFTPLALGLPSRYSAILGPGIRVSAAEARYTLAKLEQWFEVPDSLWDSLPEEGVPKVAVILEGSLRHLEARLEFYYDGQKSSSQDGEAQMVGDVLTSPSRENAVIEFFHAWGFEGPVQGGRMALREREEILKFHAFAEFPLEWQVQKGERFRAAAEQVVAVRPDWEWKESGRDWFAIETRYHVGEDELKAEQVQRMLRMGSAEQAYGRGKIAVIDSDFISEVNETLSDSEATQRATGVFEVNAQQAAFLKISARDFGMNVVEEGETELDLPEVLRPYQAAGVRWMYHLSELGMGGILADDMGLGKTLQTLIFIQKKLQEEGGWALVVCPSSLVSNWAAEAKKWVPELKVKQFVGAKRGEIPKADLIITSYAILRIDTAKFHREEFQIAVLDEAQQIKNPEAKTSLAAQGLKAEQRFALSGTPVENSLQDLWSIMHFALPGYLGPRKAFLERFEKPLRKGTDPALARRLARRLKPLVLRRLKTEVAQDLPERIEQVRYCDLSPKQEKIYRQLLKESRAQVDAADDGQKRMIALTALLRLRQACCDLRLLPGLKVADQDAGVKLAELEALITEAVAGGHRVLVFSQFVQLLQGVVPLLMANQWDYCYLDGSTKKRGEVVERFQEGAAPVFLISLKAGGVGLNLTAADTVIHLDPWWNPAVEAQATDRAHRIGQKRVVTSYKFITRGTVEEKILALQEEKKKMMASVLDGEATLVPGLKDEELMDLFS